MVACFFNPTVAEQVAAQLGEKEDKKSIKEQVAEQVAAKLGEKAENCWGLKKTTIK